MQMASEWLQFLNRVTPNHNHMVNSKRNPHNDVIPAEHDLEERTEQLNSWTSVDWKHQ